MFDRHHLQRVLKAEQSDFNEGLKSQHTLLMVAAESC